MSLCLFLQAGFQCAASGLLFRQLIERRRSGHLTFATVVAILCGQLTVILRRLIGELPAVGVVLPCPGEPSTAANSDQQRRQNGKPSNAEAHCSTSSARA